MLGLKFSADKPRVYFGICDPVIVLNLISLGVDMFDTSFAHFITEKGEALTFRNAFDKTFTNESCPNTAFNPEDETKTRDFSISLKDDQYKDDFRPLVSSCDCYTCRCHTR